jgi:hypothetical protein
MPAMNCCPGTKRTAVHFRVPDWWTPPKMTRRPFVFVFVLAGVEFHLTTNFCSGILIDEFH